MNNGLMFGMEGPNMEGTWYNPQTGDSFTVRNSFFQDNQYIVQTTDGRIIEYNQLQHYVQSDKPIEVQKPKNDQEALPAEVADLISESIDDYILPEDAALINGSPKPLGNLGANTQASTIEYSTGYSQVTGPMIELNDFSIIDKALNKKQLPDIQVGIDWVNFPVREIDMLMDVMDIPLDNIVKWYVNQIDTAYVVECLKAAIKDFVYSKVTPIILNQTGCELDTIIEPVPVVEEKSKVLNNESSKKMGGPKAPKGPKTTKSKNKK